MTEEEEKELLKFRRKWLWQSNLELMKYLSIIIVFIVIFVGSTKMFQKYLQWDTVKSDYNVSVGYWDFYFRHFFQSNRIVYEYYENMDQKNY